jgi:hypothetical protein
MDYNKFIESKKKSHVSSGFKVDDDFLNSKLFDFQKYIVKIALEKGRFSIFADTGLGKTFMQSEFAKQSVIQTSKPALILAPLGVVDQTIKEAKKYGIDIEKIKSDIFGNPAIYITNYEQLENINCDEFGCIVLDESSILKNKDGKFRNKIIESFKNTPYKLCCTATPSPNDHMELGSHAEFCGAMGYSEMLAMYFVHDGGETSKWRLRKHAQDDFWNFVCTWSIAIKDPSKFGFNEQSYELPKLNIIEHIIPVEKDQYAMFSDKSVSATEINRDLKKSMDTRIQKTAELVNNSNEQWIVWGLQNEETMRLSKVLNDSINVQGSDKPEIKGTNLLGFAENKFKVLITKTKIASFGLNYQNCHNMVFCSYDFKFEQFYQAVRRCYRFGQTKEVNVHLLCPESQVNVRKSIIDKQAKHNEMIDQMSKYSQKADYKISKRDTNHSIEFKQPLFY